MGRETPDIGQINYTAKGDFTKEEIKKKEFLGENPLEATPAHALARVESQQQMPKALCQRTTWDVPDTDQYALKMQKAERKPPQWPKGYLKEIELRNSFLMAGEDGPTYFHCERA